MKLSIYLNRRVFVMKRRPKIICRTSRPTCYLVIFCTACLVFFYLRLYPEELAYFSLNIIAYLKVKNNNDNKFSPSHNKTHYKTCVNSKDSDHPVHPTSKARVLVYLSLDILEAVESTGWSESSLVAQVLLKVLSCADYNNNNNNNNNNIKK